MCLTLSVAIFCINYICASLIDRKNIVCVVSKLIEPPWGHDWHNSDNVEHLLNTYGHIFHLTSFIADTMIDTGKKINHLIYLYMVAS